MVMLNHSRSIIHRILIKRFAIFLCEYKADHFPGVMDFRLIYADGVIAQGTAERFVRFVKDKQKYRMVQSSSSIRRVV